MCEGNVSRRVRATLPPQLGVKKGVVVIGFINPTKDTK